MNKAQSTYERKMKNPSFRKAYKKSYKELLLSELMIAVMEDDSKSVRKLAEEAHLSPSVIQNLRTGKQEDIRISNFISIVNALGYELILKKGDDCLKFQGAMKSSGKFSLTTL